MNQDQKENLYFQSFLKYIFTYHDNFKIISIFTLINLAFYVLYYQVDESFLVITFPGLLLILMLIMINTSLYCILTREHRLKSSIREVIRKEEPDFIVKLWKSIDYLGKDQNNKDLEWKILIGIISIFNAIPFCYLAYLVVSTGFLNWLYTAILTNWRFGTAFLAAAIFFSLFYFGLVFNGFRFLLSKIKN